MPEPDIRVFRNGDQTVWADMSTLQGIGVLPDGTYINTTGDEYADTLYEIIRAEHDGEISPEEAMDKKTYLAKVIATWDNPFNQQKRKKEYENRLATFLSRDMSYYRIIDITNRMDNLMRDSEKETLELLTDMLLSPNEPDRVKTSLFIEEVKSGAHFDIKQWSEFQEHSLHI